MWQCDYIDHGIAIFPDGKIRPCCQAAAEYSKPVSEISNPWRFADLKSSSRPEACRKCWENEDRGLPSYRRVKYAADSASKIRLLDFRHSNQCNLKCRYCNSHFSNQWAKELGKLPFLKHTPLNDYLDHLLNDDLEDIYWCGGEPLLMKDHYDMLQRLVSGGQSKQITLRYNTNLSVLAYKDTDFISLWNKFKNVSVSISLDAAGPELNSIRSGSDWNTVQKNILQILKWRSESTNLAVVIAPVISMLNIWFLPKLFDYAKELQVGVNINILTGPDYLSLSAIPSQLHDLARNKIDSIKPMLPPNKYDLIMSMLRCDDNEGLFLHAVRHILLLDKIRQENLFDILPFQELAVQLTSDNHEYE